MADPQQPETVSPPASSNAPVELGAGQLDGVTGGGDETVILQFGAVGLRHAVDAGGQARLDRSPKVVVQSQGG